MDPFHFISRNFWVICLVVSMFNYLAAERWLQSLATVNAEQAEVGKRYRRWVALAGAMPWFVMGYGHVIGGVPTVWYYFRPQDRDPYVLAWLGSIFLLTVLFGVWVFVAGGARKINQYEVFRVLGMRGKKPMPELLIKFLAAIGPFGTVLWAYLAASMNVLTPP